MTSIGELFGKQSPNRGVQPMSPDVQRQRQDPRPLGPADLVAPSQAPAPLDTKATAPQEQSFGEKAIDVLANTYKNWRESAPKGPVGFGLKLIGQMGDTVAQEGAGTADEAFGAGFADLASFGAFDAIASADYALRQMNDKDGKDFSDAYAQRKEEINYGLAEAREEYPGAAIAGSVAGGITGGVGLGALGGAAMKGIQGAAKFGSPLARAAESWLFRNLFVAPLAGATEGALYRLNSDGSLAEIERDAAMGALGGALFSSVLSGVGGGFRYLAGGREEPYKQLAGQYLKSMMRSKFAAMGSEADEIPDAMMRQIKSDPDAVIADLFPEIIEYSKTALQDLDANEGRDALLGLLRTRALADGHYSKAIDDALNVPRIRSKGEFAQYVENAHSKLRPRYNALWDDFNLKGFRRNYNTINKNITQLLGGKDATDFEKDALGALQKALKSRATKQGKQLTLKAQDIHNAKVEIGKAYSKAMRTQGSPTGGLRQAYNYLDGILSNSSPEYAKLSHTYSVPWKQERAFLSGYKLMQTRGTSPKEVQNLLSEFSKDSHSYGEFSSFIHGARRKIFEDIMAKGDDPEKINRYLNSNKLRLQTMKAFIGEDKVDDMMESVKNAVAKQQTAKGIEKGSNFSGDLAQLEEDVAAGGLGDIYLTLQGLLRPGNKSGAEVRAASRVLGKPPPRGSAQLRVLNEEIAKTAAQPGSELPAIMQHINSLTAPKGSPSTMQSSMAGGGIAGALQGLGTAEPQIDLYSDRPESYGRKPRTMRDIFNK